MKSKKSSRHSKSIFVTLFGLLLLLCLASQDAFADESTVSTTRDDEEAQGTLRQAINYANRNPGTTIHFDLPAFLAYQGVFRFKILRALPLITASRTTIDGLTQREFRPLTPVIMLDGTNAGEANGLVIQGASDCVIKGLIINNFLRNGIVLDSLDDHAVGGTPTETIITPATRNRIVGCFIGTDATGEFAAPNRWTGITLSGGARNNIIGGQLLYERNIISGNGQDGVFISSSPGYVAGVITSNNLVQGNFIGTNKEGNAALGRGGNGGNGVSIWCGNRVGEPRGPQANVIENNVISGNVRSGVLISGRNTLENEVRSNLVGTTLRGDSAIPNGRDGVTLDRGAERNIITRNTSGSPSVIAFNRGHGIRIRGGSIRNRILGNSIFRNVWGGITLEQPQAGEVPPNHFQIAPTLTLVQINYDAGMNLSTIMINGNTNNASGPRLMLEFFANERSELPQGHTFVGSASAVTDAYGNFRQSLIVRGNFTQSRFTCTATSTLTDDTSAFSRGFPFP